MENENVKKEKKRSTNKLKFETFTLRCLELTRMIFFKQKQVQSKGVLLSSQFPNST